MSQPEDRPLKDWLWGWHKSGMGHMEFRAPLPPTEDFPVVTDRIEGVDLPPYFLARPFSRDEQEIDVMLCDGGGPRASYDPEKRNRSQYVYVGGDNVPEEWKEPVLAAMRQIGDHWPGIPLKLKPRPDEDADAP